MYSDELEPKVEEVEEVNIVPISKWKRIICYFADLMLNLILTFVIYNLAFVPLGKLMTKYNEKDELYSANSTVVMEVLYGNKIIFQSPKSTYLDYQAALEYTCDCYLSYYAIDSEESLDADNPQFGHKEENEILKTYFINIRNDEESYRSFFEKYNEKNKYFTLNESNEYVLKDEIKYHLVAKYDPKDEVSKTGNEIYDNLCNNFFSKMYGEVMKDIVINDLTFESKSYNEAKSIIDSIDTYHGNLLSTCSVLSYFFSCFLLLFIFPLCNKHHKSVALMLMRVERLNINDLSLAKKRTAMYHSLYGFASGMYITFFLPLSFVTFNYLFSLPTLLIVAIASLLFALVSFIVILANYYNRAISDIFTNSILVNNEELDKIYRAKGYHI